MRNSLTVSAWTEPQLSSSLSCLSLKGNQLHQSLLLINVLNFQSESRLDTHDIFEKLLKETVYSDMKSSDTKKVHLNMWRVLSFFYSIVYFP